MARDLGWTDCTQLSPSAGSDKMNDQEWAHLKLYSFKSLHVWFREWRAPDPPLDLLMIIYSIVPLAYHIQVLSSTIDLCFNPY